uniref:Uncharacterized protein n=1 Tax=Tanacetum cinerariifolium TaxID=118510 RepID=A0A699HH56_TANCI|nr:hypothetical protein [Tanacetum cinerariifolium]
MFGNHFISVIKPDTKLGKGMVLHKDYLLRGSYDGNDSFFLLNCYGVRWQVEVKCLFSNIMSLVGPVWANFVMHNFTNDVTMLHFIEEGKDIFSVATYNKYGLEMHGYTQKSHMFWRCFFLVTVGSRRAQTWPLQFEPNAYPTLKSDTVALFVNDKEYKMYLAKLPSVNAPYCPKLIIFGPGWSGMMDELAIQPDQFFAFTQRWHTTHADEHKAFHKKLTPEKVPKQFVVSHKLHDYSSAVVSHCYKNFVYKPRKRAVFEMFSTLRLRCMKDRFRFWSE